MIHMTAFALDMATSVSSGEDSRSNGELTFLIYSATCSFFFLDPSKLLQTSESTHQSPTGHPSSPSLPNSFSFSTHIGFAEATPLCVRYLLIHIDILEY